jgi:hypothetical protein
MAVNLSPVGGVAGQFFDNNGNPLVGGKLFTYAAGTTTPQTTFTSSSGGTPNSNPIILNGGGRVPSEIWLTDGLAYKFVLYTSTDQLVGSWDNISGINSNFVNFTSSQEIQTATAGQTVFTLTTMQYQPGTNSLTVYVDGVNQYGPGALFAYIETDSTTITFTNGLHVGAEVKFTSVQQATSSATSADQISYIPAGTGAVATNVQAKLRETVSIKDFGAVGDGVADDTAAIQAAVDYVWDAGGGTVLFPVGTYLVSSMIDVFKGSAKRITLQGQNNTRITTTQNIVVFQIAEFVGADNLIITQTGTAKTGRAFSTNTVKQIAYNNFTRLVVNNFKFGFWLRFSLWATWDNVQFNNCGCGIKFSRNALPDDQTNPAAPGGWNASNGYFHNENMLTNVLCNGGEVGIWGTVNGCVFDAVTCQSQSDSSGASNVVLPVNQQGTGMWLQGQADVTGSRLGAQGNLISHYYAEFTRQPLIIDRCQVRLDSFFIQGGPFADKFPQSIKAINNAVINAQGCAASGQDWFDFQILATDSTVRGEIGVVAVSGAVSSLTNASWFRNNSSGAGVNSYFSLNTSGQTQTLFTCPRRIGAVMVTCTVLRDAFQSRYGTWTVYFLQSGLNDVVADPGNNINATITVSGSDIIYTTNESLTHSVTANVVPLTLLGQTRTTGLYDVP